jgi:hypothetical protein
MKKVKSIILIAIAVLALVSVASATLPAYPVVANPSFDQSLPSYWNIVVTTGTLPELPVSGDHYFGWCSDYNGHLPYSGTHTFHAYSTLDGAGASVNIGVLPGPTVNWSAINYIINHKGSYSWRIIQAVMWHYDGKVNPPFDEGSIGAWTSADQALYDAFVKNVEANAGTNYAPPSTGKYAIFLWDTAGVQGIFVEGLMTNRPPPVPEFPTVALPIAMMVGMVGVVQFLKKREN